MATPKTDKTSKPGATEKAAKHDPPREAEEFTTVDVTQETLDATPARLLAFLRGVGTRPEIQFALAAVGYDEAEHQRGWQLLHACSGFAPAAGIAPVIDRAVTEAIAALDARDERTHGLIDATLKHRVPTAHAALLRDLSPGRGAEAVVYFHTLLGRLDALHAGKLEGVSARDAKAAVEVLAKRGFTAAWRKEHRDLVAKAEQFTGATPAPTPGLTREALQPHLLAARAFYEEWARIARTELKRKDYLIALGLASRKASAKPAKEPTGGEGKPTG